MKKVIILITILASVNQNVFCQNNNILYRKKSFDSTYTGFSLNLEIIFQKGWFSNELREKFSSPFLIGAGIELNVNPFKLLFQLSGALSSKILEDFPYKDTIWLKNTSPYIYIYDLILGYNYFENRKSMFSFISGLSWFYITPSDKDKNTYPAYKNLELKSTPCLAIGLTADLNIFNDEEKSFRKDKVRAVFDGMRIAPIYYFTGFGKKGIGLKGNYFALQVSIFTQGKQFKPHYY